MKAKDGRASGNMLDGVEITAEKSLKITHVFGKNLPRFLENLPRFWRNVRDNFFFVGPFLEPFVEGFEREEMADGR